MFNPAYIYSENRSELASSAPDIMGANVVLLTSKKLPNLDVLQDVSPPPHHHYEDQDQRLFTNGKLHPHNLNHHTHNITSAYGYTNGQTKSNGTNGIFAISKGNGVLNGGKIEKPSFKLHWDSLCYTVIPKWYQTWKRKTQILENVSGSVKSGHLMALLGPSGSGKSTLLECIAGRRHRGISGNVYVTGSYHDKIKVALVPQHDDFYARFTVKETIMYASKLKNPSLQHCEHEEIVDRVMNQLGLESRANLKVLKCSGGQQKRLAIGQELVSQPNVLFLDEPTSGLDSSTCYQTVSLLQNLAHSSATPLAIIISIHQPSARVFNLFDDVYFLAHGGICIYEGPPKQLPATLQEIGVKLDQFNNPADYMIEIASGDYGADKIAQLHKTQSLRYQSSVSNSTTLTAISDVDAPNGVPKIIEINDNTYSGANGNPIIPYDARKLKSVLYSESNPFFFHTWLHFKRGWVATVRDPILMNLRLGAHTIIPLFFFLLFGRQIGQVPGCPRKSLLTMNIDEVLNLTSEKDIIHNEYVHLFENYAFIYLSLYVMVFMSLGVTALTFPLEAKVFRKEYRNGWYDCITYFLGRSFAEVPFQMLFVSLYVTVGYFATGQLWAPERLLGMIAICLVVNLIAQTQGFISGAIFMDHIIAAVFMAAVMTVPMALFNSFFVRLSSMEDYVKPVAYTSYFFYAFEALIAIIYGFGRCVCSLGENVASTANATLSAGNEVGALGGPEEPEWTAYLKQVFNSYLRVQGIEMEADEDQLESILSSVSWSGLHWTSNCTDYRPVPMAEFDVHDYSFANALIILSVYVLIVRVISYLILLVKVNDRN